MDDIIKKLKNGSPILIFDGENREGETDIVIPSQFVTYEIIHMMRRDGGGLICTTLTHEVAEKLGLKYLVEIFKMSGLEIFDYLYPNDIPYDEKSAFSITINHRKTFTGIPDRDRALTIKEFANFIAKMNNMDDHVIQSEFGKIFRSPGHVHLLIASDGLLKKRRGHTELSTSMMIMAGLIPSATIVEMLGDDGYSLEYNNAKSYAKEHDYPFIEGTQIIEWWENWSE
ncbi:MAG: 3,4-dihydroxy-2-butanone-4-phosphate synthase [Thermoplasmata archaeon]